MIRAIIVDDEQPAIDVLKYFLGNNGKVEIVGAFTDPAEVLKNLAVLGPDLVFLDIDMPGMNGINLGKSILAIKADAKIVFVTAFRNYAVEAFDIRALDYLLKPLMQEKVDRAVGRMLDAMGAASLKGTELAGCKVFCLGKFEVYGTVSDEAVKWRTSKVEELFAYLLCNQNITVPKLQLIDKLWPDDETGNVENKLHATVSMLKKSLKEAALEISIQFSSGGYRMEPGSEFVWDAEEFSKFAAKELPVNPDTVGGFEKIAGVYRGGFLQEKEYRWCITERNSLQKKHTNIIKKMVVYFLGQKDFKKAEDFLHRGIEHSPLDEELHELLLATFFLQNNRTELIRHYRQLEKLLQEELGLGVRAETRAMYENFLTDEFLGSS